MGLWIRQPRAGRRRLGGQRRGAQRSGEDHDPLKRTKEEQRCAAIRRELRPGRRYATSGPRRPACDASEPCRPDQSGRQRGRPTADRGDRRIYIGAHGVRNHSAVQKSYDERESQPDIGPVRQMQPADIGQLEDEECLCRRQQSEANELDRMRMVDQGRNRGDQAGQMPQEQRKPACRPQPAGPQYARMK